MGPMQWIRFNHCVIELVAPQITSYFALAMNKARNYWPKCRPQKWFESLRSPRKVKRFRMYGSARRRPATEPIHSETLRFLSEPFCANAKFVFLTHFSHSAFVSIHLRASPCSAPVSVGRSASAKIPHFSKAICADRFANIYICGYFFSFAPVIFVVVRFANFAYAKMFPETSAKSVNERQMGPKAGIKRNRLRATATKIAQICYN